MPPRKRKIEVEANEEGASGGPLEAADIEVKKERLSQEEVKDGEGVEKQVEGKSAAVRNLRPRKSTCYIEKDSPEVEFEEKQKKGARRKRRPASSQDGSEEKEAKIKRSEKGSDGLAAATPSSQNATPCETDQVDLPYPTLVSCTVLNSENLVSDKQTENNDGSKGVVAGAEGKEQSKQSTEKKRVRKRPKPKAAVLPLDPDVVPKTEPISPSALPRNGENGEGTGDGKQVDSVPVAVKPKPKKRIRNRKPAVVATNATSEDGKATEEDTVIKQEVEDNDGESGKKANEGENEKSAEGKAGEENGKPSAAPRKRPAKKKAQVKKDSLETASNKADCEGLANGEREIKVEGEEKDHQNSDAIAAPTARKRVKNRPKKPAAEGTTTNEEGKPEEKCKEEDQGREKTFSDKNEGEPAVKPQVPAARKPFFRGRRSKSISARSGRKEIIHTEEAIDPEDIRGFEHVEKFVTPVGVRLPKFWDSEDEMSEDENSDNFRRIMCGFGTNCRIHEVIRPASEIVRRLKELQNTFGATKSLPLFQKDGLEMIEDPPISTSAEPSFRKDRDRMVTWHTDPSFFKYANNYPSKCK